MRVEVIQRDHVVDLNRFGGALPALEGDGGARVGIAKRAEPHRGVGARGRPLSNALATVLHALGPRVVHVGQVPGENLVASIAAVTVNVLPCLAEPARARPALAPGGGGRGIRWKGVEGAQGVGRTQNQIAAGIPVAGRGGTRRARRRHEGDGCGDTQQVRHRREHVRRRRRRKSRRAGRAVGLS